MSIAGTRPAGSRPGRRRDYPGWPMVWALAVTETISYGVLYYSFAAFLLPMQHSLGYSQAALTGAFSLSVLLTGAGAIPAGAWLDCCGARGLMTAGSLLAAGCVLLWAQAGSVLALYLAFAGIGLAGAAVLYEPAFATVNAYFDVQRRNALLTLTMVAGLASTVFLPGSALLISHLGWRHALLILAVVQAVTVIPHVLLLRRRPADHGWQRDGVPGVPGPPAHSCAPAPAVLPDPAERAELAAAVRSRPVMLLTGGGVLGSAAIAAVAVHLLAYLRLDGYSLAVAAAAAGALGVVQVAGRVVLTASARRLPAATAAALLLGGQAVGVAALLLISGPGGVVLFVVLFGAGFGSSASPARTSSLATPRATSMRA
jgi:MFS family permease